jgi:SAM-dependent methyltransferase
MIKFNGGWGIKESDIVLDAGGGVNPWERANVVADLHIGEWANRKIEVKDGFLIDEGKKFKFVQTALEKMPFEDKSFDFCFFSHTLEHVDDPARACEEVMRVGKRGLVRCPEIGRESLWGDIHHRWFIHLISPNTLVIFPKQEKDKQEVRLKGDFKNLFWTLIKTNPIVEKCVMKSPELTTYWYVDLLWKERFNYVVINENGEVKTNSKII